jgi:hypothetical protein
MFFVEKIVRRTLLRLMMQAGLTAADATVEMKNLRGIWAVGKAWKKHDPSGRGLETVIGKANWDTIAVSAEKRNDLVHGSGNEGQRFYKGAIASLMATLDDIHGTFSLEYGYAGWR